MKKLILLSLIFVCSTGYGQTFVLTPNGLRDSLNLENNYVVINFEGKTAKQLYDSSIKFISKNFHEKDNELKTKIDNEFINYDSYVKLFLFHYKGATKKDYNFYSLKCTTELNFKDGKIKYLIPDLKIYCKLVSGYTSFDLPLYFIGKDRFEADGIWDSNLNLQREREKLTISNYFNQQINELVKHIKESESW